MRKKPAIKKTVLQRRRNIAKYDSVLRSAGGKVLTVRLDESLRKKLAAIATAASTSEAELVRHYIDETFAKNKLRSD